MCASQRVSKPVRRKEADWLILTVHSRPTLIFREGFECEHTCRDPKDGELCLSGRPEETLVEARSDTDANRSPDLELAMRDEPKPGYGAQLRANLEPTKGVGRQDSRTVVMEVEPLRIDPKSRGNLPDSALCANFKGDPLKFEPDGRLTATLPTPETAQPEVGSSGWKSTARRVVSVHSRALENRGPKAATPGRTHNRIRSPSDRLVSAGDGLGTALSSFPGAEQPTQNCALNVKVKKFNQARFPLSLSTIQLNHSQGNGLGRISGKEDPVELDSSPTL
ncbi:hypothetical protein Bca4012_102664 [Brassica carinata]